MTRKMIHAEILFEEIKELLKTGGMARFRVSGMSMWPFLCHDRDFVILKSIDPELVQVGDIVLLRKPDDCYLLHRVTAVNGDLVQTTGDYLIYRDGWFSRDTIIGVVDSVIRKGKVISCSNPFWKAVMTIWRICFPFRNTLVIILQGISRWKHKLCKHFR